MERGRGRGRGQLLRGRGRGQGQVFWPRGRGLNATDLRSVEFIVKRVMIKLFCTYDNSVSSSFMSFFGSSSVTVGVNFSLNLMHTFIWWRQLTFMNEAEARFSGLEARP